MCVLAAAAQVSEEEKVFLLCNLLLDPSKCHGQSLA